MEKYLKKIILLVVIVLAAHFIFFRKGKLFKKPLKLNFKSCEGICSDPIEYNVGNLVTDDQGIWYRKKKLAVLVPYRNTFEELLVFVPHMSNFLNDQKIPHHIYMLNHADFLRYNKGAMINVGYLYTKDKFDYIDIHDIDTLPMNEDLPFDYPSDGVFHMFAPWLTSTHNYGTDLGGVLLVSNKDFQRVNGMSNSFWGSGHVGDEFKQNIKKFGINVRHPDTTEISFLNIHGIGGVTRYIDDKKCHNQSRQSLDRNHKDGLSSTNYKIFDVKELTIDYAKVTILSVELECDKTVSPWCDCRN